MTRPLSPENPCSEFMRKLKCSLKRSEMRYIQSSKYSQNAIHGTDEVFEAVNKTLLESESFEEECLRDIEQLSQSLGLSRTLLMEETEVEQFLMPIQIERLELAKEVTLLPVVDDDDDCGKVTSTTGSTPDGDAAREEVVDGPLASCGLCKEKFPTDDLLTAHLDTLHKKLTPVSLAIKPIKYKCNICKTTLSSITLMQAHIKVIHKISSCSNRYIEGIFKDDTTEKNP